MRIRSIVTILFTSSLFTAVAFSMMEAAQPVSPGHQRVATLQNVRTFVAAPETGGTNYAVDGGLLYRGTHGQWTQVTTPPGVIVSAVLVSQPGAPKDSATLFIGAANEMALFHSTDGGQRWNKFALSHEFIGGITDLALNASQSTLLVGTDTAGIFRVHLHDHVPNDHVPNDHVPNDHVPNDHVPNDHVPDDHVPDAVQLDVDGHWPHDKPIVQLAVDSLSGSMIFARTDWELWHLRSTDTANRHFEWRRVVGIDSAPTGVVVVPGDAVAAPATAYVGTQERGVLRSRDGATWTPFNTGLAMGAGAQLRIDALAADPAQPGVLYVATSHVLGSRDRHYQPAELAYVAQHELPWSALPNLTPASTSGQSGESAIAQLLPVSGKTGAVYALTTQSRSPVALGSAPPVATLSPPTAVAEAAAANPLRSTVTWSWAIAGLAGLALVYAVVSDLRRAPIRPMRAFRPQQTDS